MENKFPFQKNLLPPFESNSEKKNAKHLICVTCVTQLFSNIAVRGRERKVFVGTAACKATWGITNMATILDDAICNVRQLETINLPDEQPQIEAPPASVTYISNFDTNFEDSKAFITCISKYLEEADVHKGLVGVTSDSHSFKLKK